MWVEFDQREEHFLNIVHSWRMTLHLSTYQCSGLFGKVFPIPPMVVIQSIESRSLQS